MSLNSFFFSLRSPDLRAGSPAIDRGDSWAGPATDRDGCPRRDDPAVPNQGSPDYFVEDLGASLFAPAGEPRGWRGNNNFWLLTLPFSFPLYDKNYSTVLVSSNGFLHFEGP